MGTLDTSATNSYADTSRAEVAIAIFEDGGWMATGASGVPLSIACELLYRNAEELGRKIKDIHVVPWFI